MTHISSSKPRQQASARQSDLSVTGTHNHLLARLERAALPDVLNVELLLGHTRTANTLCRAFIAGISAINASVRWRLQGEIGNGAVAFVRVRFFDSSL